MLVHLVDVSSSTGRDPVEDFDVDHARAGAVPGTRRVGRAAADKPVLVAANKIDALDDPERLERLERICSRAGIPLYPVSAATGEGLTCCSKRSGAKSRGRGERRQIATASRPVNIWSMTSGTRIGILGGTFDPVHSGTSTRPLAARDALALDRVLVLPSGMPPHRAVQPSASPFHRFAMAALA